MPRIIENVRTRSTEEGADCNVIYKSNSFGFSSDAAKRYGISAGSPAVPASADGKQPLVKAVPASRFTIALFDDGEFGTTAEGVEVDLAGKAVVLVTDTSIRFVNDRGVAVEQNLYQLSSLLKGTPKEPIEELVKLFDIGEGVYREVLKDAKGIAIPLAGVTKPAAEWTIDDVQTKETTTVNDFTMSITDKIVEFTCAGGYKLEGCFGLVLELNTQSSPKDDRVTKEEHQKKRAAAAKKAAAVTAPTAPVVAQGMTLMTADAEEEIETEEGEEAEA